MVASRERPQRPGTGVSADKPAGAPSKGSVTGGRERYGAGSPDTNAKQPDDKPKGGK